MKKIISIRQAALNFLRQPTPEEIQKRLHESATLRDFREWLKTNTDLELVKSGRDARTKLRVIKVQYLPNPAGSLPCILTIQQIGDSESESPKFSRYYQWRKRIERLLEFWTEEQDQVWNEALVNYRLAKEYMEQIKSEVKRKNKRLATEMYWLLAESSDCPNFYYFVEC